VAVQQRGTGQVDARAPKAWGHIPSTVEALRAEDIVVLCGRNERLRGQLGESQRILALGGAPTCPT
jgi:hypothetical protein